ncbi:hypothetical protein HAX54_022322, partial [Datura stramonium]|nr:hypothetical protein [Datura stramonium]
MLLDSKLMQLITPAVVKARKIWESFGVARVYEKEEEGEWGSIVEVLENEGAERGTEAIVELGAQRHGANARGSLGGTPANALNVAWKAIAELGSRSRSPSARELTLADL